MTNRDAQAANEIGKALVRQGRRDEAAASFARAIRLDPEFAEAHNNFGNMLNARRDHDAAIGAYRRAIGLNPRYVEAYFNLGNALRGKGETRAAIDAYRMALTLRPTLVEAHNGLGNVLLDDGRHAEAMAHFNQVIAMRPGEAMGYNNLATVLRAMGRPEPALQALDTAIALEPAYALAHHNRGLVLSDLGNHAAAIEALKRAVSRRPEVPEYLAALVRALRDTGRPRDAIAMCDAIVRAMPTHAHVHCELAALLQEAGRVDEAHAACLKALALKKTGFPEAHNVLGNILRDQGRVEDAIRQYRRALDMKPDAVGIRSNLLFTLQFASGHDSAEILEESRRWADLHETPLLAEIQPHANDRGEHRRLRIGYVSSYFRLHSAAFFLIPVLSHHDPGRVQVFCYAGVKKPDAITDRFKSLDLVWRDTAGLSDAELAARIRADEIDILIDINLHMQDSRLLTFARKPAPVQVTWLGYPGTTGLATIDYRFTDPYLDPAGHGDHFYTERSVRLPHSFWCYAPLIETPEVSTLPAREAGHVTFGCLNNFQKATGETLDLWAEVLAEIPRSRLIILSQPGAHRDAVRGIFAQRGVGPERLEFVPRLPLEEYFRLYQRIDVGLDTTPYPGHTTTLDGLWMGVPVITLAGQTVAGRGGVSILSNMDLEPLIARNREAFVAIAASTAAGLEALSELRSALRPRLLASPLMNARLFATHLEDAYSWMWRTYTNPH